MSDDPKLTRVTFVHEPEGTMVIVGRDDDDTCVMSIKLMRKIVELYDEMQGGE